MIQKISEIYKESGLKSDAMSMGYSVLIHLVIGLLATVLYSFTWNNTIPTGNFVTIDMGLSPIVSQPNKELSQTPQPLPTETQPQTEETVSDEPVPQETEQKTEVKETTPTPVSEKVAPTQSLKGNLLSADTTQLRGIYKESSLDVTIRYPEGWNYLDQQKKKKLDGVTFIGKTNSGTAPYIFLKVEEKYRFNPNRYKSSFKTDKYVVYHDDERVMAGQYTLELYLRTEDEEDYSIKLIVIGEQNFKEYKPVFLAMVKTFSFGK